MKSNIPKQPCAGKCTDFKEETCDTCLIRQIEKREFELGVAPEKDYVKTINSDYLKGDVVVSLCDSVVPELFEVRELPHVTYPEFVKCRPYPNGDYFCWLAVNEIRKASTTELKFKRRLTNTELSQAEVS